MYTCKDCVYYYSMGKGKLGYCQLKEKKVSPYDVKCDKFVRRRVGGR